MPLNAPERETVIVFSDADEFAEITTHQRRWVTKLRKNPAAEELEDLTFEGTKGARFRVPANLVSIRSKQRKGGAGNIAALDAYRSTKAEGKAA
jgi:hypothetical protein